jgi:hypothetical protein
LEWLMRRGFQKMPLWSLRRDHCILWRLSSFFYHQSKIILIRDSTFAMHQNGVGYFLSYGGRKM